METALADPNCRLCHGSGRVKTGEHIGEEAICHCVILRHRRAEAERIISDRLPERARQMTLDGYETGGDPKNEQALAVARNFVDHYEQAEREGWVLGFWGLPSSGKTHLTLGIVQDCVRRYNAKPFMFNVSAELRRERERFRAPQQRYAGTGEAPPPLSPIDRAVQAELLVLDDLGAEYHRQGAEANEVSWVYEQLYNILEERIMACRPTLFSSNLSPSDLTRRMGSESGKRVLARIERAQVTPALEVIEVAGTNRQSEAAGAKLFAPRLPKEFELHNRHTRRRKLYDEAALRNVVARFRERHGDEAVRAQLTATRVLRDGAAVHEPVDLADVSAPPTHVG